MAKKRKLEFSGPKWNEPLTHASADQGCQIFLGAWLQNRKNVPDELKMYQMVLRYPEWP
jgi:hypothetical protein